VENGIYYVIVNKFAMKYYYIQVFRGGIPVSICAVKNETLFYQELSRAIYNRLSGIHFMTTIYDDGILLESNNIPDSFLGSTIPFVYRNHIVELRVYPQAFNKTNT
jgi:hypothetical protein